MDIPTNSQQPLPIIIQNILQCEQLLSRTLIRTNLHRRRKTLEGMYNIMITLAQRVDLLLDSETFATNDHQQILNQLIEQRGIAENELANGYLDFGNVIEEIDDIRAKEEEDRGTVQETTQNALICAINIMRISRRARVSRGENPQLTESMSYILDEL